MANLRNILLRIAGEPDDALDSIDQVKDKLRQDIDNKVAEARVEIHTAAAEAQLTKLQGRFENIKKQIERDGISPELQIKQASALRSIERVEERLDKLSRKTVDIDVDVDRHGRLGGAVGGIAGATRGLLGFAQTIGGTVLKSVSAATQAFAGIGGPIAGVVRGVSTLATGFAAAGAAGAALAVVIGVVLVQAFITLGGVIVALTASLAAAAAGLGALTIAFGAAMGPVVAVVIAAFSRLSAIMDAVTNAEERQTEQARAVAGAQDQVRSSTDSLADAQSNLRQQAVAAWQAYRDAVEDASDAVRAIEQAELGVDFARLNVKEAQQALKDFQAETRTTGNVFDAVIDKFTDVDVDTSGLQKAIRNAADSAGVALGRDDQLTLNRLILEERQARLNVKDALDSESDARRRSGDAAKRQADFIRDGIDAYEPYRNAIRQVARAETQLARAQRQRAGAIERQNEAMAELTPKEREFAELLLTTRDRLKEAFSPAVSKVLDGMATALGGFTKLLTDAGIQRMLENIGDAIGDVFATFGREAGRQETRTALERLGDLGARLVRVLGSRVFRDFFRILSRIADVAGPPLIRLMRRFADWVGDIEQSTRNTDKLKGFIDGLVDSFKTWIGIGQEVVGIVGGFLRAAVGDGDKLAGSIRRVLNRWNDWINSDEGQRKLKEFFNDVRERAVKIWHALKDFAGFIKDAYDQAKPLYERLKLIVDLMDRLTPLDDVVPETRHSKPGLDLGKKLPLPFPLNLIPGNFLSLDASSIKTPNLAQFAIAGVPSPVATSSSVMPTREIGTAQAAGVNIEKIEVRAPEGSENFADPRAAGVQLAREVERRFGGMRS